MLSLLIAFFLLSLVVSFLCSLWEAVLLSITPSYAEVQIQQGERIGIRLRNFKDNIDRPLAAILTLNTAAHTVGAIGVGEQAAVLWGETSRWLTQIVVPVTMTLAILVFSEIVPKTMGATYWHRLAPFTVHSLRLLLLILAPFVWMSQWITRSLKHDTEQPILSRTDFLAMAEIGARDGTFEDREKRIITNLLNFETVQARDIMTPRTVVAAASGEQPIRDAYEAGRIFRFSRIPVYEDDSKDRITGYVLKDALLTELVEGRGNAPLRVLRRDIVTVSEDCPITEVFRTLMDRKEHIAQVLDDFGGMAGIITMEDVIETLLGLEIVDETDATKDMRILAQRHRARRARALGLLSAGDDADRGPQTAP
ncbi:MAG: CNNM domain-containing protein [Pseudomonadota bacterium]